MSTNSPNHDAAMVLAKTVGTNIKTLRNNKRNLAHNIVLAVAVEGFAWVDTWAAAKKQMGFAKLEKPEQNQVNVFGSAIKTIVLAWPTLQKQATTRIVDGKTIECSVADAFIAGDIVFSTLATAIKDAEKAADKAEAEQVATSDAGDQASKTPDPRDQAPAPAQDRSDMIAMVTAMFRVDADAAAFTPAEIAAMTDLIVAVDAFKAATIAQAQAA